MAKSTEIVRIAEGTRKCRKCHEEKEMTTEFYPRNNNNPQGVDTMCKDCWRLRSKERSAGKQTSAGEKVIHRAKKMKGYEEAALEGMGVQSERVNTRKPKTLAESHLILVPFDLNIVKLNRYADLPKDLKLYGHDGDLDSAIKKYKEIYGQEPKIVYAQARYFFEQPPEAVPDVSENEAVTSEKVPAKARKTRQKPAAKKPVVKKKSKPVRKGVK